MMILDWNGSGSIDASDVALSLTAFCLESVDVDKDVEEEENDEKLC